ncbi:MAG: DsbA family protein, partial [Pseudomonadota bacterium]
MSAATIIVSTLKGIITDIAAKGKTFRMTGHRPALSVDMVSDLVCPWCYIGFRGLDWARMALSFEYTLSVRYRPYRLDPDTPA